MDKRFKFSNADAIVYKYIKENKDYSDGISLEVLLSNLSLDNDTIRRSLEYLKSEDILLEKISKKYIYKLDTNGKLALDNNLLEEKLCDYLYKNSVNIFDLKKLNIKDLKSQDVSLAFGIAKSKGLISIKDNKIFVNENYKKIIKDTKNALVDLINNKNIDLSFIKEFIKRKFIIKKEVLDKKYIIKKDIDYYIEEEGRLYLTSDMIKSKNYKNIKFKKFDVEKLPSPKMIGRIHPLEQIIRYIKEIYIEMGFKEIRGPYVESSFWNMDSMFIAQDHPMRDIQDTFYLPISGDLPNKDIVEKVSKVHETGGDTNSKGHKYKWDPGLSKKLVLRTHTTSVTFRKLSKLTESEKEECKFFSVGRVFRNETLDSTHLPEFNQAEGFVIGKNLGLADLMGFIKDFSRKLGINKIKFKPNYNPYTEPSVEAFAYFEKEKMWIEFINSGIFRAESLAPYGIKQNVIAWGLGVERIAMLIYQKSIKEIFGDECDLNWLRTYPIPKKTLD